MANGVTADPEEETLTAESPIVPSAPANQAPEPVTFERPDRLPTRADVYPQPPTHHEGERARPLSPGEVSQRAGQRYQAKLDRWNAQQMYERQQQMYSGQQAQLSDINRQSEATFKQQGVATQRNPDTGMVEPVRDESGNLVYHPGKGPVQYDETGKPFQEQRTTAGPKTVQLDTDAPIDTHPDRPNELYKQNKYSPWDYLGTVQEGLQSSDKDVQTAAQDAQLKLDKRLHGSVGNDLGRVVAQSALDVQAKSEDFHQNSADLKAASDALETFDQDHPGLNEKTHVFGGLTPQAQALQDQKKQLSDKIDQLSGQGYSALDPDKNAADYDKAEKAFTANERKIVGEHGKDLKAWRETSPKENGDLDQMLSERQAGLIAAGKDPNDDPIFQSLEKRKSELGIGQPGQPAQDAQDAELRADPTTAPLMQERDQLDADHQTASDHLDQLSQEYTKRIQPVADQLNAKANQVAPLQAEYDTLSRRLSQIDTSTPAGQARAQTLQDRLNPIAAELQQRQAELAPLQEAHAGLVDEFEQGWQSVHDQYEAQLAPRREDLDNRFQQAVKQKQVIDVAKENPVVASILDPLLLTPNDPQFKQNLVGALSDIEATKKTKALESWDFEPNDFERELFGAPFRMAGEGLKGFARLSEGFLKLFPGQPEARAYATRAVADTLLKVPGVLSTPESEKSIAGKTGGFIGGVGSAVGAGILDPAILVPQFFGQGVNGQMEAAERAGADQATALKAGVLGGTINALLAIPFEGFGKSLTEVFGSTKESAISAALRESYERGGAQAVANDLNILRNSMVKTAGASAFKQAAVDALQPVIEEITRTPLQRVGTVAVRSAQDAGLFGAVQLAQNAVTRTYNPDTGLFENVGTSAAQGVALGAFFGGLQQFARAQKAAGAHEEIAAGMAKQARAGEVKPMGVERALPSGQEPEAPTEPAAQTPPDITAVHDEIDNLAMEGKTPEEHAATQTVLRGLVKIAQGEPIESLTAAEKTAVLEKGPDGLPRVEVVKGTPVITNSALQRVQQIAPITSQIMPQDEESQRQAIVHPPEEAPSKQAEAPSKAEIAAETPSEEQSTFAVEVQNAKGETEVKEVQAATEEEAHAQVAQTIEPGQGLIRDVTKTAQPGPNYVPPDKFVDHVVGRVQEEAGRDLQPQEEQAIRSLAGNMAPAYERWSKAFNTVNATIQPRQTAGAMFHPGSNALEISLPDLARQLRGVEDKPENAGKIVTEEALHSVLTQIEDRDPDTGEVRGPFDFVKFYDVMPQELKDAMLEAYKANDSPYAQAHEFWRMFFHNDISLEPGRKIRLRDTVLHEQTDRAFIQGIAKPMARVLRYMRDLYGELQRKGVSADVISQVREGVNYARTKIKEVDAHAGESVVSPSEVEAEQVARPEPPAEARGPPARAEEGIESAGSDREALRPLAVAGVGPAREPVPAGAEGAARTLEPATRAQLAENLSVPHGAIGHATEVTQGGQSLNVAYVAQEAAQSQTSHDAQGRVNPVYDQSLQPRDRSLPVYQKQSQNIARNLDFAQSAFFPNTNIPATTADMGAPIMTPEGHTVIGNGREIGIKLAHDEGGPMAAKYKQDFIRNARKFGIDPATVRAMKAPILKRVILDDVPKEDLIRFSQESNEPVAMGTNAIETARRDASRLTPQHLSLLNPNYELSSAKNSPFMRAYLRDVVKGKVEANEANLTSTELANRVRSAIFTHAYGVDEAGRAAIERLAGEADPSGKTITNGLLTVAPIVARMRADIKTGDLHPDMDIAPAVTRAAQDIATTLQNKPTAQPAKQALDALYQQRNLVEEDPLQRSVLEFLLRNRTKRRDIEQGLSNFVEAVYALGNPKQVELFTEGGVVTPLEVFKAATSDKAISRKEDQRVLAAQALNKAITPKEPTPYVGKEGNEIEYARIRLNRIATAAEQRLTPAFRDAVNNDAADGYPGLPGFWPSPGLTREERMIEAHFAQQIARDKTGTLARYEELAQKEFGTPYYLNMDLARELYGPYNASRENRLVMERATSAPAGYVALAMEFSKILKMPRDPNKPFGMFLSGGMASGKTTAVNRKLGAAARQSAFIYDSVFANDEIARERLALTEAAGLLPLEVHVYRPFVAASKAAINRTIEIGRPVPLSKQGQAHYDSQTGFLNRAKDLSDKYVYQVLSNEGKLEDIRVKSVDDLSRIAYRNSDDTSPENLKRTYGELINKDYAAGRLDNATYAALRLGSAADEPPGLQKPGGAGVAGVRVQAREHPTAGSLSEYRNPLPVAEFEGVGSLSEFPSYLRAQKTDSGTLDLFNDYAANLPPAAKVSKPALKEQVEKDVPALSENEEALANLFASASPKANPPGPAPSPEHFWNGHYWMLKATREAERQGKALTETTPASITKQPSEPATPTKAPRAKRAAPVGTETATGVDDLFSLMAKQHQSERDSGLAGGTGKGAIGTPGPTDVERPADISGHETDAGRPIGSVTAGDTDGGRGLPTSPESRGPEAVERPGGKGALPKLVTRPTDPNARNYVIPRDTKEIAPRGAMAKLKANQNAIRLLKQIEGEQRLATPEEKSQLVKFSGWGALSQAFDERKADQIANGQIDYIKSEIERYKEYASGNPNSTYYQGLIDEYEKDLRSLESWRDKWGDVHAELKSMLTPEEYKRAMRSTINAHYTSPEVINSMWDIASHLGFKGGSVLEPGAGVGHFFGLMPEGLVDRSKLHAVELDDISGRLTKLLYPEADVQITGFQNADIADGSVDLAISNVPFANVPVTDKAMELAGGPVDNLHDYFLANMIKKLKPGGLNIAITSAFTMDKGAADNRRWMADRADLVAAFRLPNDAFRANAGTDVVTDIVVLRKKDGQIFPHAKDWTMLDAAAMANGGTIRVNQYFAQHPNDIIGFLADDGEMFAHGAGEKEMTVHGDPNRPPGVALAQALDNLPKDVAGDGNAAEVRSSDPTISKMGNIVLQDGKYFFHGQEAPDEDLNNPKNAKRVRRFIEARDVLNEQYRLELSPEATDEDVEGNRRILNQRYDAFVADFSNFHTPKNKSLFIDDPDWFRLAGAETPVTITGGLTGKEMLSILDGKKSREFTKADVFKKRVLTPIVEPTKADSLEDAFGMSLGWRGRVDLGYIADLTGKSREEVEQGLVASEIVVRDPETGQLLSREQYLAGNVRKKLEIAKAAGPDYERNARLLETVQPEDVPIDEIRFKIGATWVPVDAYKQYLETIGVRDLPIEYHPAVGGGRDFYTVKVRDFSAYGVGYKDFQTEHMSLPELMDAMLNMKRITVKAKDENKKVYVDEVATMTARDAAKRLSDAFVAYAKSQPELGERLAGIYNREVNGFAQRTYNGQFLTLPWVSKDFDIFPDKKNVIWRAIQDGRALIAWGVGGGKTVIATGIALEMRRLGLARKPMMVVHNSTLEQYATEIANIAPSARVLIGRKDELQGAKRKEFLMRIAAGDWDAVVIAHSTFGLIEDDPVFQQKHMESLVDEAMHNLGERGFDSIDSAKSSREPSVKQLVKMIEKLEGKLAALSERKTDTGLLNFQQLGVDALIVDEVHAFKKMPFSTKLDVKGIDSGMSDRGYAMLLRARSIQERNGGKNVFSMTGTPVTNTLGEIWNQVRLVAPDLLKEYGVETFDQFVSKFAEVETISEAKPSGERVMVERLSKIVNLPEWSTFFRQAADVKLGDDMVVKNRPGIKGGGGQLIALDRTPGAAGWVNYIRQVLEGFKGLRYDDFKENKGLTAIPVQAYVASRAAAIDIRLVEPRAKDEPGSKANRAVRGIIKLYRESTPYRGTQVIFSDSFNQVKTSLFDYVNPRSNLKVELDPSKEPGTTFNLYDDIKAKLIRAGVPAEEIAIVSDKEFDNAKRKKLLFEKINQGKVRIVMGSTEKLGTGVNMQERMLAAWNLDVPWTAAGLEQRDGRVYRQGNVHAEMGVPVELNRLGMKDTLDESLWRIIERKLRIQKQALSGKIVGRELEEMSDVLSLAEQAAILSGPYGAESFELDQRIRELYASRIGHDRQVANRDQEIRDAKRYLSQDEAENLRSEPSMQLMSKLGDRIAKDGAQITVDGDSFKTKTAMVERIDALLNAEKEKPADQKSPSILSIVVNGVPIRLKVTPTEYDQYEGEGDDMKMVTKPSANFNLHSTDAGSPGYGRVTSAATLLARLEELSGTVQGIREGRKNNAARLKQLSEMKQLGAWPYEEEYQNALVRQKELLRLMRGEEAKPAVKGEPNASTIRSTEGVGLRGEGEGVGGETSLRQQGETAEIQEGIGSGELAAQSTRKVRWKNTSDLPKKYQDTYIRNSPLFDRYLRGELSSERLYDVMRRQGFTPRETEDFVTINRLRNETTKTEPNTLPTLPARETGPAERPEELKAQALTDSSKTIRERFEENLPLANRIAGSFSNIPGVERGDIQSRAKTALLRASRAFDPSRGVPFKRLAYVSIENELKRFYGQQTGLRETTTLDETLESGITRKDLLKAPTDVRAEVARDEANRVLTETISELPARMQETLSRVLDGQTFPEIAKAMGVSKQGAQQLAVAAMKRLKGKMGERGVRGTQDLLSQPISQAIYHVTDTGKVESIKEKGLLPMQTSNWVQARSKERYGSGEVYAFDNFQDAVNWAAKMDWEFNKSMGTGKISVVRLNKSGKWAVDASDPLSQIGAKGTWLKRMERVHPEDIDRAIPVTKDMVRKLIKGGGISAHDYFDLLSQVINDSVKEADTDDPMGALMDLLKNDPLETLRKIPVVGRPDLALGTIGPEMEAVHEFHTETATPQKFEQWEKQADQIIANRGKAWGGDIVKRWTDGGFLEPAEVRATQKYLIAQQGQEKTPAEQRAYDAAAYAYTKIGEATARMMASRRDPFKTPEERNRDFLAKAISFVNRGEQAELDGIKDKAKRVARLQDMVAERRRQIGLSLEYLTGKGVTLEDILSGGTELRLVGAKIIENQMKDYGDAQKKALRLAQKGEKSAEEIAKLTGLSAKAVRDLNDERNSDIRRQLMEKALRGATAENLDPMLLAQPTEGAQTISKEAAEAEVRKMMRAMGLVDSKDLGKMKVTRRRTKPRIFVPPPVTGPPVEPPTPGELPTGQERQAPLIKPAPPTGTPPAPGAVPYPQPSVAPYTGRVLGQPGLPLYQELMIRKGADLSNPTDVATLGRIIGAAANGNRFDMLYEAWLANILSGPTTHLSYKLALAANLGLEVSLQRGVESLVNLAVRDPKSAQVGEFPYIIKGLSGAMTRAIGLGVRQFGSESELLSDEVLNQQVEAFGTGPGSKFYTPAISERPLSQLTAAGKKTAVARGMTATGEALDNQLAKLGPFNPVRGRVLRMPLRVLMFVQGFYAQLSHDLNVGAFAYRQAKAEGLSGDKLSNRINELVATPGSDPHQKAVDFAEQMTFRQPIKTREQGGNAIENLVAQFMRARSGSHLLGSQMPFVELPFNLFRIGLRKSPFGAANLLSRVTEAGFYKMKDGKPFFESYQKADFVKHTAEQLIAWTIAALLWNLAWGDDDDGDKPLVVTGGMPTSTDMADMRKSVRELYERAYGGPTQIIIGGRNGVHFNYGKYEPVATVLGTVVNTIHQLKHFARGEQGVGDTLSGIWAYSVAQAEEKTFLRGLSKMLDSIRHPSQAGGNIKELIFSALVPNLIRQPLRNIDDYIRDYRTASPLYSSLPTGALAQPKIDVYGKPVQKQGNWFTRMFVQAGVRPDPVLEKADQLTLRYNLHHPQSPYAPSVPLKKYKDAKGKDVDMTPEQGTKFQVNVGKRFSTLLRGQISQAQVNKPTEDDIKLIRELHTRAMEQVKREMFPKGQPPKQANVVRDWLKAA